MMDNIKITVADNESHQQLVAEIYIGGHYIGCISEEIRDQRVLEVESSINIPVAFLRKALDEAEDRLNRLGPVAGSVE